MKTKVKVILALFCIHSVKHGTGGVECAFPGALVPWSGEGECGWVMGVPGRRHGGSGEMGLRDPVADT